MKKLLNFSSMLAITSSIIFTGCTSTKQYKPSEFTAVPKIKKETKVINAVDAVSNASFNYEQDPAILKAYKKYITEGEIDTVTTKGFIAYPFTDTFEPVINSQPLNAVDIMLEPGEKIIPNSIVSGDTNRWKYTVIKSYNNNLPVQHIIFKPVDWDIATNIIAGTNKRTYHFKVVSTKDAPVKQIKFWYPEEMQKIANEFIASQINKNEKNGTGEQNNPTVISEAPNITFKDLNFEYTMSGDDPTWKPIRVFSDGVHTYIQFPTSVKNSDLPVLYVYKDSDKQLVNYRVKGEYFVVDGVFSEMVLILGRPGYFFNLFDDRQEAVYITNTKMS